MGFLRFTFLAVLLDLVAIVVGLESPSTALTAVAIFMTLCALPVLISSSPLEKKLCSSLLVLMLGAVAVLPTFTPIIGRSAVLFWCAPALASAIAGLAQVYARKAEDVRVPKLIAVAFGGLLVLGPFAMTFYPAWIGFLAPVAIGGMFIINGIFDAELARLSMLRQQKRRVL